MFSAAEEQAKQFARSGALQSPSSNVNNGNNGTSNGSHASYLSGPSSSIRAFPTVSGTHGQSNPAYINLNPVDNAGMDTAHGSPFLGNDAALQLDPLNTGDGFGGPESMALHQVSIVGPLDPWLISSSGRTCSILRYHEYTIMQVVSITLLLHRPPVTPTKQDACCGRGPAGAC